MSNETTAVQTGAAHKRVAQILSSGEGVWQESPLVALASDIASRHSDSSSAFHLRERPFVDLVTVRGSVFDGQFVETLSLNVGCKPHATPNKVSRGPKFDVLWLGPDEWMVMGQEASDGKLARELQQAFAGQFVSVVDVSSGYTVLELSGRSVREVLSRGCPLDVDASVFRVGDCAQSHYFKASIILHRTGEDSFELIIRRSFADYFCRMLIDASDSVVS